MPSRKQLADTMPCGRVWCCAWARNISLLGPLQHRPLLSGRLIERDCTSVPTRRLWRVAGPLDLVVLRRMLAGLLVPARLDKRDGRGVPAGDLRLKRGPADAGLQRQVSAGLLVPCQLDEFDVAAVRCGLLRRGGRPRHAAVQRPLHGGFLLPPRVKLAYGRNVPNGSLLPRGQRHANGLSAGRLWRVGGPFNRNVQRALPWRRLWSCFRAADVCVFKPLRHGHLLRARLYGGPAL